MFCRLVLRIQESIKPKTGSVLMTNVAETKGLPHRAMSSLTQALFKQTSTVQQGVCDRTQVWQMAGSPNYVPRRIKKVERAHLFLFEGSKVQHICYKCGPVRMHLSQQRPQGTVSYLYCVFVVSDQSPFSDCHNGEKRSAVGFLQCLFPLTEPEYMKAFSALKMLESIHHGQGIFAERSRCCPGGP